jgi:glycosyltransferase involved in cell wall biosynthesis
MWRMVLPPHLARAGEVVEARLAPPLYRRTPVVTLSESARRELVSALGFRRDRVHVVSPGVDARFSPGGMRSPVPLVLAVGRLVPVKRVDVLVDVLVELRRRHPTLEAVVVGDGYERDAVEAKVRAVDAESWLRVAGRVGDDELVDLYRRAWVLASASAREGWGMTVTEAGACATPAVVTRVPGHVDAVDDGRTGLLAEGVDELTAALDRVLSDGALRARLGAENRTRARSEFDARDMLAALAGVYGEALGL